MPVGTSITTFSSIESELVGKNRKVKVRNKPVTWNDKSSDICNQIRRGYFDIILKLRGAGVIGNHSSKYGSKRFSG